MQSALIMVDEVTGYVTSKKLAQRGFICYNDVQIRLAKSVFGFSLGDSLLILNHFYH